MPINYKEYHPKWSLIRRLILKRAGDKCEWCSAPNHQLIYRDKSGWHLWPQGMESEALSIDGIKSTLVILTIAHINRDKTINRFNNLAALCQRCHLKHDIHQHTFNKKYGRQTKYLNGKLF